MIVEVVAQLFSKAFFVEQVSDPNRATRDFVFVGRANTFAGGADLGCTTRYFTRMVERSADGVRATPSSAPPLAGDRLALVKAFAERAARSEGLPALDTVDLQPRGNSPTSPALLPKTFGTLTLRQAKPPLDGPCIDPRVEVNVFDAVVGPPSVRIVGVAVECAKEPATGSKAPPDAGRPLPRAAAASLPFIAICDSINFAWGYQHSGRVIDKRGDVYTQVTNDGRSGSLDAVG